MTKSSTRGSEPEGTSFKQRAGASWMMDLLELPTIPMPSVHIAYHRLSAWIHVDVLPERRGRGLH